MPCSGAFTQHPAPKYSVSDPGMHMRPLIHPTGEQGGFLFTLITSMEAIHTQSCFEEISKTALGKGLVDKEVAFTEDSGPREESCPWLRWIGRTETPSFRGQGEACSPFSCLCFIIRKSCT